MSIIVLSPTYYLEHFEELLAVIEKHHIDFLDDVHLKFIADYKNLSLSSRCLFIRMLNREGNLFHKEKLVYAEIEDISSAWDELSQTGIVSNLEALDCENLYHWFTKEAILSILDHQEVVTKKSSSKAHLILEVKKLDPKIILDSPIVKNVICLRRSEEIHYLLFLYYGKLQKKLILHTLRDLGIKKSNKAAAFKPKFQNKEEAKSFYFYANLKASQKKNFQAFGPADLKNWPEALSVEAQELKESILLALYQNIKDENPLLALDILNHCLFHPASEKRARLLHQLGYLTECQTLLEKMMDSPQTDEELLFAEDFLERKFNKKKISLLTETLRRSEKIPVDESFFRHPEHGVLDNYKTQGIEGYFSENFLWVNLFWILFKEELESSVHSEFDHATPDLKNKTFYLKNRAALEKKCEYTTTQDLLSLVQESFAEKSGDDLLMIEAFIKHAEIKKIMNVLLYMAEDYYGRNSGYPDLFIIKHGEVVFIEVKAEGDSIKNSQIKQMRQLEKAGFNVKILQVYYQFNDNQTYVIVDLETTGTLSSYNRITEIGAVKIKGNEVIGTFQTLINPGRSIPRHIQELTGITNEMVREAPSFEAIAEEFSEFVKDSIFVAHNVAFDYGFLQNEFERLEKRFVKPYICTKAGMKKYYPGIPSYGLKNLCQHFGVSLNSHHRALCDAQAASQLLILMNNKRKSLQVVV